MPSQKTNASAGFPLFDSHTVQTPEQMQVVFAIAGIGSRFLAIALDFLIQAAITILAFIGVAVANALGLLSRVSQETTWMIAILIVAAFLLYYGYFMLFEIFWNGQTPGKRIVGIRVVKDNGHPLSALETIGRNLMRIVDQLPGFYAIGLVTALLNRQNKRLGDYVAGSIVLRERSLEELKPAWQTGSTVTTAAPRLGAERLLPEDVALIDTFLQRRHDLQAEVRYRMGSDILRRLAGKLTVEATDGRSTEAILEAAVYERRGSL
jgi:uncharacterized RDD family membrane protein YckC